MKKVIKTGIVCMIYTLFFAGNIFAQDFQQEMKNMFDKFKDANQFKMKMKVSTFSNQASVTPHSVTKSLALKKGNQYYYEMNDIYTLINETCIVILNNDSKSLIYSPIEEDNDLVNDEDVELDFSPMAVAEKVGDNFTYLGEKSGLRKYQVASTGNSKNSTDIFIDVNTGLIKKMIYLFDENVFAGTGKIIIEYTQFDTNPSFAKDTFSEFQFVNKNPDGEIKPLKKYETFHFIINKLEANE